MIIEIYFPDVEAVGYDHDLVIRYPFGYPELSFHDREHPSFL